MSESVNCEYEQDSSDVEQGVSEIITQSIANYLQIADATHYIQLSATTYLAAISLVDTAIYVSAVEIEPMLVDVEGVVA